MISAPVIVTVLVMVRVPIAASVAPGAFANCPATGDTFMLVLPPIGSDGIVADEILYCAGFVRLTVIALVGALPVLLTVSVWLGTVKPQFTLGNVWFEAPRFTPRCTNVAFIRITPSTASAGFTLYLALLRSAVALFLVFATCGLSK